MIGIARHFSSSCPPCLSLSTPPLHQCLSLLHPTCHSVFQKYLYLLFNMRFYLHLTINLSLSLSLCISLYFFHCISLFHQMSISFSHCSSVSFSSVIPSQLLKNIFYLCIGPGFVKFFRNNIFGGHLAPSSHCSILIETPQAGKARWKKHLSIVLTATMDLTNSKI